VFIVEFRERGGVVVEGLLLVSRLEEVGRISYRNTARSRNLCKVFGLKLTFLLDTEFPPGLFLYVGHSKQFGGWGGGAAVTFVVT
jgi:hypothetical protein